MSFSATTKNELARIPIEETCCLLAELAALVRMNGNIRILGRGKLNLRFITENAAIARRIFSILKEIYDTEVEILIKRNRQLKKNNNYTIIVNNSNISNKILIDVGFIEELDRSMFNPSYKIKKTIIAKRCCKRSYIRGSFLGGGSISNPEKTYHLEMVTNDEDHAEDLAAIINSFDLNAKVIFRKSNYVVYIKEGKQISDILNIMGAHQALLKLEDIRVLKDIRNNINRLVNCETANLDKTINASMRQIADIETIQNFIGLDKLPRNLKEIARLRLNHREASLKELGQMLEPPVGKSGINHRFRKIGEIAKELRGVR